MSAVNLPYTYSNGLMLDAAGHNKNLYSLKPGDGVYSEGNGGFDVNNFSTDFILTADIAQPEQVTFARAAGSVSTLDNMGDVNLNRQDSSIDVTMQNQSLPGCGLRVYLPFKASAVLWEVSYFFHVSRFQPPQPDDPEGNPKYIAPLVNTKLYVDGVPQDYTQRRHPPTLFLNDNYTNYTTSLANRDAPLEFRSSERAVSQYRDIIHLATTSSERSRGWHEAFLALYVQPRSEESNPVWVDNLRQYRGKDGQRAIKGVQLESRLTVGCRSARVLAFL